MLILLPPSEGKSAPTRGKPLDLAHLSFGELTRTRERVLEALVELCSGDPAPAARVLGLGATQIDLVARNADLRTAPTARADRIYTGVVYDAIDFATLDAAARRRATSRVAVVSSLFGLVRPGDRIPSYRLSGDTTLPGLGPVAAAWRTPTEQAVLPVLGSGLLVDLRSGTYANFWKPPATIAAKVASVRVLHEVDGVRKVVSHFNKATKGRIVRDLLVSGAAPRTVPAFAGVLRDLGWSVEVGEPGSKGTQLDVVVADL